MKTLKTLTAALFIALMFNTTANYAFPAIAATANSENELYRAIEQLVQFPKELTDRSESAYVWTTFYVDEQGWIEVTDVQGKKEFAKYIKKQMEMISVEDPKLFSRAFKVKVKFDFRPL